jgi:hypothetical protein
MPPSPSNEAQMREIKYIAMARDRFPDLYFSNGQMDLTSQSAQQFLQNYEIPKAFNKIGYARSLGGFFYQFFFAILGSGVVLVLFAFMLKVLYPFPESKSYVSIAGILFAIFASLMNVPTGYAIEQFLGQYRVKDPRRMIQYIRFYIWYQMVTGVFLVAGFSVFVIYFVGVENSLVWAKWLMLILIAREFPANTGIFLSALKGLQRFDYESWLNFLNDSFLKPSFEIGFVLWGRYILGANPVIGELLGISIGFAIGTYVVDFVSMGFAMVAFRKAIKPMGYTMLDCWIPHIDRDVIWDSIKFGFSVSYPGLIGSVVGTFLTFLNYNMIPGILTLNQLSATADELANVLKRGGGININATISEAANNNKKELTSYYISMSWKFIYFFVFAIGSILLSFMPLLLSVIFDAVGATEYALAAVFIIPNILATIIEEPVDIASKFLIGANRPIFNSNVEVFLTFLSPVLTYFWLFVVKIQTYPLIVLIWWIPLNVAIPNVIRLVTKWWYIHKKICPVKFKEFFWQAFIAPLIPSLIIAGVAQLWSIFIFPLIVDGLGGTVTANLIAGVCTVLFGFVVCLMFIFFPLYTFFGGHDENTLAIFHEAVEISGPSRFLFRPIDKAMRWLAKISPLHGKFPIAYEAAEREAQELMKERYIKDRIMQILRDEGQIF